MSTLPPPPAQVSLVLSSLRLSCPSSIRLTIAPAACLSHRNGRSSLKPIHPRLLALSPHSPIPVDFTGHRTLRFALLGFRRTAQPVRPASRIPGTSSLYRRRSRYFTPASSPVFSDVRVSFGQGWASHCRRTHQTVTQEASLRLPA